LGSLLYGYDLGVIAGAVDSDNLNSTFQATTPEKGAVVSVFTGGAFIGAALAGPSGDFLGRKKTILLGAVIFILGGALQAGAQALSYLYAGRGAYMNLCRS
jgi:MFS family permease